MKKKKQEQPSLKNYIYQNFKEQIGTPPPKTLEHVLFNINAGYIALDDFKKHFKLEDSKYKDILNFLLDPENSYEIGKYGQAAYEKNTHKSYYGDRKYTCTDDYDYDDGYLIKHYK